MLLDGSKKSHCKLAPQLLKLLSCLHLCLVCCLMCVCVYSLMPVADMAKSFLIITAILLLAAATLSSVIPPPEVKTRVLEQVLFGSNS